MSLMWINLLFAFVQTAAIAFALFAAFFIVLMKLDRNDEKRRHCIFHQGYDAAVRDIMRYGFYIKDGERHEVENICIWSD